MSRTATQNLELVIRAREDAGSFQTTGQRVRQQLQNMENGGGGGGRREGGRLHGFVESLNESFGRRSTFTHLLHVAEGAGAAAGLSLLGRMIGEAAEKAAELRKQFHAGQIDAMGMTVEIGKSIPFIGSFVSAGQQIRELITGEKEEIERIALESKITTEWTERRLKALKESREVMRGIVDDIRRTAHETGMVGMLDPVRTINELRFSQQEFALQQFEGLRKKAEEMEEGVQKKWQETFDALKEGGLSDSEAGEKAGAEAKGARDQNKLMLEKERKAREFLISQHELLTEAKINQAMQEASESQRERDRQNEARIAGMFGEVGGEAALRAGHGPEFQRQQIESERERRQKDLTEGFKKRMDELDRSGGASREYIKQLQEMAEKESKLIDLQAQLKAQDVDRDADLKKEETLNKLRQERIAVINQEIQAGNHLHEQEKARLETEDQFAQRRQQLQELMRTAADNRRRQIKQEIDSLGTQQKQVEQARVAKSIEDAQLTTLKAQAEAGNNLAKMQLDRLEIQKRFREEAQQLMGLLTSPGLSLSQRGGILGMLFSLGGSENAALSKIAGPIPPRLAGLDASGGYAGLGQRAREEAFLRQGDTGQNEGKTLSDMFQFFQKFFGGQTLDGLLDKLNSIFGGGAGTATVNG